jgi:hypothetical protein
MQSDVLLSHEYRQYFKKLVYVWRLVKRIESWPVSKSFHKTERIRDFAAIAIRENLQTAVRLTPADIEPNLTILDMMSLSEQFHRNFNQDRLIARLTELLGLLVLVLACVGLYGVTAYSVARRTSEIGIPVALAGGRLLESQLCGVKSYDPLFWAWPPWTSQAVH